MATPRIYSIVADAFRPYRWPMAIGGAVLFVVTRPGAAGVLETIDLPARLRSILLATALLAWGLACATFWFNSKSGTLVRPSEFVRNWDPASATPRRRLLASLGLDLWFLIALMILLRSAT